MKMNYKYFFGLFYDLALVTEIYCSWITLGGPDVINKTNIGETTIPFDITPEKDETTKLLVEYNSSQTENENTVTIMSYTDKMPLTPITTVQNDEIDEPLQMSVNEHNDESIFSYIDETLYMLVNTHNGATSIPYIDKLVNRVTSNMQIQVGDISFSSFITQVQENNISDIEWKQQEADYDALEVTIFNEAILNLKLHSTVKLMLIRHTNLPSRTKIWNNESKHGPLIIVKTESTTTLQYDSEILRIKINKTEYVQRINENWICVYWSNKHNNWSTDGLNTTYDGHFIICSSNHLSTFSILLDPYNLLYLNDSRQRNSQEEQILTTISIIGSLITIPCLLLIIVIYNHKSSSSETNKILINSCISLLAVHLSYHIYTWLGGFVNCLVINVMTHYSVMSFLLWTAFDGINMWRILFSDVFNTKGYIFYRWYKIISWGIPLVTVITGALVIDYNRKECKLYFHRLFDIIAYTTPCTIILCCNMLIFLWMVILVTCKNSLGRLKDKKFEYVIALTQVFGIGWCVCVPLLWFRWYAEAFHV